MQRIAQIDEMQKNIKLFQTELKIFANQRLFEKKLISEDMYFAAEEQLQKSRSTLER